MSKHVKVVGEYPTDHYEDYACWTPDMTFQCGSRIANGMGGFDLCEGVAVFEKTGFCNSPPGYYGIYANYVCIKCGSKMGIPTCMEHKPVIVNGLVWNGTEFVEMDRRTYNIRNYGTPNLE